MTSDYFDLHTDRVRFTLHAPEGGRPRIVYWGPPIPHTPAQDLDRLATRQPTGGSHLIALDRSLTLELAGGPAGPPGLLGHRNGRDWGSLFRVTRINTAAPDTLHIHCRDETSALTIRHSFRLSPESDVLEAWTGLQNDGAAPFTLDWCAAASLPVDGRFTEVRGFSGQWAREFDHHDHTLARGTYLRETRSGRPNHDSFPACLLLTPTTGESQGLAAGFHLGWSGNHRLRVDQERDGQTLVQAGECLFPGEVILAPGDRYETPRLHAAISGDGLNGVSQAFHRHVRHHLLPIRQTHTPRPVHYNTWEAVYFLHEESELRDLADRAAALGVERFVLDDGWFGGRRGDSAGLGDWHVTPSLYPNGLKPLADHVRSLGMGFGLWFEPEMVNEDSDLYRAHPDWVTEISGVAPLPFRHQRVLDLSNPQVTDYLFTAIDTLIRDCGVAYIKWDMNRDNDHPASGGRAQVNAHVRALYGLLDRLRTAHPDLEIESCSSGGGRPDFGILSHTNRVWTSDSNDAHDRQLIQRGASYFLPLDVLGAHIGPRRCHITARTFPMAYRAATALFGHMGLEMDLREMDERETAQARTAIAFYKRHRALLHSGDLYRGETSDAYNVLSVVARDRSEALVSIAKLNHHPTTLPERLCFQGLTPDTPYRVQFIWPEGGIGGLTPSILTEADLYGDGAVFSGAALINAGLQLPLSNPDTCLIAHLRAERPD